MMKTITQNFILAPVKKMYNDNRQLYIQIFDCKEKAFSQFFLIWRCSNLKAQTDISNPEHERYFSPYFSLTKKRLAFNS